MKDRSKYMYELILFWGNIYTCFEEELQLPIINSIVSEYCSYFGI